MFNAIKSAALASIVVLATSAGAFASSAEVTKATKVTQNQHSVQAIDWAIKGEEVWIEVCGVKKCFVERKWGKDGWVRKAHLKAIPEAPKGPEFPFPGGIEGTGVSFCIGGDKGSFCFSGQK